MNKYLVKNNFGVLIFLRILRFILQYLAYNPLTFVVLINITYFIVILINLAGGDMHFLGTWYLQPLLKIFGASGDGIYNETDMMTIFGKLSLAFYVTSLVFFGLYKFIAKKNLIITEKVKLKIVLVIITFIMLVAQASTFFTTVNGANTIRPILLIFWGVEIVMYSIYFVLNIFAKGINYLIPKV